MSTNTLSPRQFSRCWMLRAGWPHLARGVVSHQPFVLCNKSRPAKCAFSYCANDEGIIHFGSFAHHVPEDFCYWSLSPLILLEWKAESVSRVATRHHKTIVLHHAHVCDPAQDAVPLHQTPGWPLAMALLDCSGMQHVAIAQLHHGLHIL
jgi:hypothetical protein